MVVVADQLTKYGAGRWYARPTINEGGYAQLPDAVAGLWAHPRLGAALDLTSLVVLTGAGWWLAARSWRGPRHGAASRWHTVTVACAVVWAGLVSNLGDRYGMSAVTQPGSPRGAVDWLPVRHPWPGGAGGRYNVADVVIAVGVLVLVVIGARAAGRVLGKSGARGETGGAGGLAPVVAVLAALVAGALWVGLWQGDRQARDAERHEARARSAAERENQQLRRSQSSLSDLANTTRLRVTAAVVSAVEHGTPAGEVEGLLEPDQRLICHGRAARTGRDCVVVAGSGQVTLEWPLLAPAWARAAGLPTGRCNLAEHASASQAATAQQECLADALTSAGASARPDARTPDAGLLAAHRAAVRGP